MEKHGQARERRRTGPQFSFTRAVRESLIFEQIPERVGRSEISGKDVPDTEINKHKDPVVEAWPWSDTKETS